MKKFLFMWLFIIITLHSANAQTTTITGTVTNGKGNPLHFVFIGDEQYKNAAYSDSIGNFTIIVHPDSKLKFELDGYRDTSISIYKNKGLQVVLRSSGSLTSNTALTTKNTALNNFSLEHPNNVDLFKLLGHQKGNVHGSRYLFENFVHGFLITSNDDLLHDPTYTFDYDKVGGALLLTQDKSSVQEISYDRIKSFTLYSPADVTYVFEKATAIDPSHYVQVLSTGNKYKIYKLIKTRFLKSDYVNTGVASHGNDFDEYIDDADYYVLDIQTNQPKKISLKKKAVKDWFPRDSDKANKFAFDSSGKIDDLYLGRLGDYMNQ